MNSFEEKPVVAESGASEGWDKVLNRQSGFRHVPIDEAAEVRLLRISIRGQTGRPRYTLEARPLRELAGVRYRALSYNWGEAATVAAVREVSIDGQVFYVRRNLYEFLRTARARCVTGLFFIDAICINQLSARERQAQVQAMATVFRHADQVVAWLGMPEKAHFDDVRVLAQAQRTAPTKWSAAEWAGFTYLSCHPYWSRVWIVQEVLLASAMTVWCGPFAFPRELFQGPRPRTPPRSGVGADSNGRPAMVRDDPARLQSPASVVVTHRTRCVIRPAHDATAQGTRVGTQEEMLKRLRRAHAAARSYQSRVPDRLYDVLAKFGQLGCSDKRDRLYGFLGLLGERTRARVQSDYTQGVAYAYRQALKIMLQDCFNELANAPASEPYEPTRREFLSCYCIARDTFEMPEIQSIGILKEVAHEICNSTSTVGAVWENLEIGRAAAEEALLAQLKQILQPAAQEEPMGDGWLARWHTSQRRVATRL